MICYQFYMIIVWLMYLFVILCACFVLTCYFTHGETRFCGDNIQSLNTAVDYSWIVINADKFVLLIINIRWLFTLCLLLFCVFLALRIYGPGIFHGIYFYFDTSRLMVWIQILLLQRIEFTLICSSFIHRED